LRQEDAEEYLFLSIGFTVSSLSLGTVMKVIWEALVTSLAAVSLSCKHVWLSAFFSGWQILLLRHHFRLMDLTQPLQLSTLCLQQLGCTVRRPCARSFVPNEGSKSFNVSKTCL